MSGFIKIFTVIAILIGIFLFLDKGDKTASIIKVISENSVKGIATLQGR